MESDGMPRTALYDDPALFDSYQQTRSLTGRLNELVELPALLSLMPNIQGVVAADLGCGTGGMCRWLSDQGATYVSGYDPSERMLAVARQDTGPGLPIHYTRASIEELPLKAGSLDLVISGLALHYVSNFAAVVANVATALLPGGSFIFSVEHPILTCYNRQWHHADDGSRSHWPVDDYLQEGSRLVSWMGLDRIPRHHRTVAGYINPLIEGGLSIRRLLEPSPDGSSIAAHPRLRDQLRRPPFLVVRADKPR